VSKNVERPSIWGLGQHQKCFDWTDDYETTLRSELNRLKGTATLTGASYKISIWEVPFGAQGNTRWDGLRSATLTHSAGIVMDGVTSGFYAFKNLALGRLRYGLPAFLKNSIGPHYSEKHLAQDHTTLRIKFKDGSNWYLDLGMVQQVLGGGNANTLEGDNIVTPAWKMPRGWVETNRQGARSQSWWQWFNE
jgi:hypothetical protein